MPGGIKEEGALMQWGSKEELRRKRRLLLPLLCNYLPDQQRLCHLKDCTTSEADGGEGKEVRDQCKEVLRRISARRN